jgi:hypothetical protein
MAEDKGGSEGTLVVDEDLFTSDEKLCKLLDSLSFLDSSEATSDTVKHLPSLDNQQQPEKKTVTEHTYSS